MRADGESTEGSWVVREEWILGGTAAVCILSMLRRPRSTQDMVESGSLCSEANRQNRDALRWPVLSCLAIIADFIGTAT
jgi:hypothetical protein